MNENTTIAEAARNEIVASPKPTRRSMIGPVFMMLMMAGGQTSATTGMDRLGGGLIDAICGFIGSPIVLAVAAVALITLIVLWIMDEARGFMGSLLKIGIGVAVILNVGTILTVFGLDPLNCGQVFRV